MQWIKKTPDQLPERREEVFFATRATSANIVHFWLGWRHEVHDHWTDGFSIVPDEDVTHWCRPVRPDAE